MVSKVVGVGWAKTGTTTLGACFQILGFKHASTRLDLLDNLILGDLDSVMSVAEHFDSFDDWPWTLLFREFDNRFKSCKFVMTTRSDDSWIHSYRNMLRQQTESVSLATQRAYLYGLDVNLASDQQLLERRKQHEDAVRQYFSERTDQLLEINWELGDGWQELCTFLNLPEPKAAFPHRNKGVYKSQ